MTSSASIPPSGQPRTTAVPFHGSQAGTNKTLEGENLFPEGFEAAPQSEIESRPIEAAALPRLFSPPLRLADRVATSQPNHFANVNSGYGVQPSCLRRLHYRGDLEFKTEKTLFLALSQSVLIAREPHPTESSDLTVVILGVTRPTVSELKLTYEGVVPDTAELSSMVSLRDGAALTWNAVNEKGEHCLFVSVIDESTQQVRWTKPIFTSKKRIGETRLVQQTASGDVAVLYDTGVNATRRLCRLDQATGESVYDVPARIKGFYSYVSQSNDGSAQIFHNDEVNDKAIIGVVCEDEAIQFVAIDFSSGKLQRVDKAHLSSREGEYTVCPLGDGSVLFLPTFEDEREDNISTSWKYSSSGAERFRFDENLKITKEQLEMSQVAGEPQLFFTNQNHDFAVRREVSSISFFALNPNQVKLIKSVDLPNNVDSPKDVVSVREESAGTVMTANNIVYCSQSIERTADGFHCRLSAFDATDGELLWNIEEHFKSPPMISVNFDGSIAWLDEYDAIFLKN